MTTIILTPKKSAPRAGKLHKLFKKHGIVKGSSKKSDEMSLAEYISSGAIDRDERAWPFTVQELIEHLHSYKKTCK